MSVITHAWIIASLTITIWTLTPITGNYTILDIFGKKTLL